ncbi:MAG: hypothetical protein ABIR98_06450 [Usitatibacter sp.]
MKPFTTVTTAVLAFIAILQLARFALGWEVLVNGVAIPLWFSLVAAVVLGGLAFMLWRERGVT